MLVLPSLAHGAEDPAWFVVVSETEPVRCGDQEIYYTIEEYQSGTMLAVDGTSGDYSKVRYPAELGAFVPARDAQSIKSGSRIKLSADSQLSAASMLRGLEGSWCPVFESPVKAGTEMMVLEIVRDEESNEVQGYRVAPPRPPVTDSFPYVYIRTDSLRPATPEEIKQHQGGKQITTGRPALRATPNAEKNQASEKKAAEKKAAEQNAATEEPAEEVIDLREKMVVPETTQPTETKEPVAADDEPKTEPAVIKNAIPVVVSSEKSVGAELTPAGLEALEASFKGARTMPREQLDEALPELLAEFTRSRRAAGDDESAARPLDQRIEWLKIRIQTRDQRRAITRALASADEQSLALNSKIQEWNDSRVYTLVGRLMLSGVYTGEHLPLLYRLRAPDPITGIERTIGYIAPNADQDLRKYLGSVVGVIGDPVHDDALALTVLSPVRVDSMPGQ